MPDLSLSRQEMLSRHLFKQGTGQSPRGSADFQHDNQKMSVANSLFQAVTKGNLNKVRILLDRGANLSTRNDYGHSPLVAALHIEDDRKRARMFRMLLDKGASHKARDEQYDRPVLLWASVLGQFDQVKCLLEETAGDIDLHEKDKDGFTALHHAVRIGSLAIVEKLVDYHVRFGVSVDAVDKLGLTPYLHARRLGYKDIAAVLRNKGLASAGHGDNLFRSPREWSQIGKFERKKAIELQTQDQINAAKVLGKLNLARYMENSPRLAVPGIVVPSYRPEPNNNNNNASSTRKPPHHLSVSLPSLGEAATEDLKTRPSSTGRNVTTIAEGNEAAEDKPGPPVTAFVDSQATDSKSSMKSSSQGQFRFSTHDNSNFANNVTSASTNASSHTMTTKGSHNNMNRARNVTGQQTHGSNQQTFGDNGSFGNINGARNMGQQIQSSSQQNFGDSGILQGGGQQREARPTHRTTFAAPVRTDSNIAALSLLEQTSFSKGRIANQFHHSEFDKSKASEYKNIMGNLNAIMEILSEQQTKSFRKSVPEMKKPDTPPKAKKRSKISTFAILFGDKKSARRKKSKSPARSSAKRKGGKDARGKGEKTSAKASCKGDNAKTSSKQKTGGEDKTPRTMGKMDKLPVPTIKIN